MSLNRVLIMGNLGQDPELRYTQSQTAVVTMSVATTDYRTVDGERQEQTEWHRVVVWAKQAENCAKYLKKGRSVFVEGRLQTRSWEDREGQKRYTTEIVAQNVRFMGGGRSADNENTAYSGGGGGYQQPQQQQPASQPQELGGQDSGATYGGPATPSLDEIPF